MERYLRALIGGQHPGLAGLEPVAPTTDGGHAALTWMRNPLPGGGEMIWHNGLSGGYASYCGWRPDTGRGLVILSDTALPLDAQARDIMRQGPLR